MTTSTKRTAPDLSNLVFGLALLSAPVALHSAELEPNPAPETRPAPVNPSDITIDDNTNWYQISIVVFKHRYSAMGNEAWPDSEKLDLSFPQRYIQLSTADSAPVEANNLQWQPFAKTDPLDEEFNETLRSLKLSSNYEIMTEVTWNQPALDQDTAIPVLIHAGKEFGEHNELEGTITLAVARYLHLKADLRLAEYVQKIEPVTPWETEPGVTNGETADQALLPPGGATPPPAATPSNPDMPDSDAMVFGAETVTVYEAEHPALMVESRRMRSGELHYLDNPLFGVLVKVIRLEADVTDDSLPDSPVSQR